MAHTMDCQDREFLSLAVKLGAVTRADAEAAQRGAESGSRVAEALVSDGRLDPEVAEWVRCVWVTQRETCRTCGRSHTAARGGCGCPVRGGD